MENGLYMLGLIGVTASRRLGHNEATRKGADRLEPVGAREFVRALSTANGRAGKT